MAKKKISKGEDGKILFAFLATFLSVVGFAIALIVKKEDKYVMFYAKQSLVIFVFVIIAGIVGSALGSLFIVGSIIEVAINVLILLIWVLSWIYALSGKKKQIPIISYWTKKIEL